MSLKQRDSLEEQKEGQTGPEKDVVGFEQENNQRSSGQAVARQTVCPKNPAPHIFVAKSTFAKTMTS